MDKKDWTRVAANVFWSELAPCDHILQIYQNDDIFISTLMDFITAGIRQKDCVLIIATTPHLFALNDKLIDRGYDLAPLIAEGLYMPLDAEEVLTKFMVGGLPSEKYFSDAVFEIIDTAQRKKKKIRAFGEMVALLWARGNDTATIQLERMWSNFCNSTSLSLFCAYPETGFTQAMHRSVHDICCAHSKMINGTEHQAPDVYYKHFVSDSVAAQVG